MPHSARNRLAALIRANAEAKPRSPLRAETSGNEATIYLYDVIVSDDWFGGVAAEDFVKELSSLTADTIHLRINSPGGDVFAARAMEAAVKGHQSKVIAHIDGLAASAATFVALAADDVEISDGAMFMVHKAWTIGAGNADELMDLATWLEKVDGTIAQSYAKKTGESVEDMAQLMTDETWMTAVEALEAGFVDRIADEQAENIAWDLSVYDKAPQVEAAPEQPETESESGPKDANVDAGNTRERYEYTARLLEHTSN